MTGRCAAIRTLDEGFRSIDEVQEEKEAVLVELALRTVTDNGADVVILAGARQLASPTRSASAYRCRWSMVSRPP